MDTSMEVFSDSRRSGLFPRTRWTLIQKIQAKEQGVWTDAALNELCSIYWRPIFKFIRLLGQSAEDAEDLTQGFFARSVQNALFANVDPRLGKLRTYICVAVNNYVIDQARKGYAKKRGGNALPNDLIEIESRLCVQYGAAASPEKVFARQCGRALLNGVWEELQESFRHHGQGVLFEALAPFIAGRDTAERSQVAAARDLGMTPRAFWNRLDRARKQYRELLTYRIAQTVGSQAEIEDELQYLQRLFAL